MFANFGVHDKSKFVRNKPDIFTSTGSTVLGSPKMKEAPKNPPNKFSNGYSGSSLEENSEFDREVDALVEEMKRNGWLGELSDDNMSAHGGMKSDSNNDYIGEQFDLRKNERRLKQLEYLDELSREMNNEPTPIPAIQNKSKYIEPVGKPISDAETKKFDEKRLKQAEYKRQLDQQLNPSIEVKSTTPSRITPDLGVFNEKARKQNDYKDQLDAQRQINTRLKEEVESARSPNAKCKLKAARQRELEADPDNNTGLLWENSEPLPTNRRKISEYEAEERRKKIEKQRLYAEEIKTCANGTPLSDRTASITERRRSVNGTSLLVGEELQQGNQSHTRKLETAEEAEMRRRKIEKQRLYAEEIKNSTALQPVEVQYDIHREGAKTRSEKRQRASPSTTLDVSYKEPQYNGTGLTIGEASNVDRRKQQNEYAEQLKLAQQQIPIEKSRVPLHKLKAAGGAVGYDALPQEQSRGVANSGIAVARPPIMAELPQERPVAVVRSPQPKPPQQLEYKPTYGDDAERNREDQMYYDAIRNVKDRLRREMLEEARVMPSSKREYYDEVPSYKSSRGVSFSEEDQYQEYSEDYRGVQPADIRSVSAQPSLPDNDSNDNDMMSPKSMKRAQQSLYANEIAQAAALQAPTGDRVALFRTQNQYRNEGINLPGNPSFQQMSGQARNDPSKRGYSSGGGASSLRIG